MRKPPVLTNRAHWYGVRPVCDRDWWTSWQSDLRVAGQLLEGRCRPESPKVTTGLCAQDVHRDTTPTVFLQRLHAVPVCPAFDDHGPGSGSTVSHLAPRADPKRRFSTISSLSLFKTSAQYPCHCTNRHTHTTDPKLPRAIPSCRYLYTTESVCIYNALLYHLVIVLSRRYTGEPFCTLLIIF